MGYNILAHQPGSPPNALSIAKLMATKALELDETLAEPKLS